MKELNIEVKIDLERINGNLQKAREVLANQNENKVEICLMLKADAYGHGLEEVAKSTENAVDSYGVATLKEAVRTRKIAPTKSIIVNMLEACEIESAVKYGLTIGLSNREQLEEVKRLAKFKPKLHLAVDSGMHRLGFDLVDVESVVKEIDDARLTLDGVYSHFGDHPQVQAERFERACKIVRSAFPHAKRHIASSHTYSNPAYVYDGVRLGLDAYMGAMTVKSQVIASRRVDAGEYVGYGEYMTQVPTNVAVIFGGYADGVGRNHPFVKWQGKRFKVICVCMDVVIVDTLGEVLKIGDEVTLVDSETLGEIAKETKTIPYTLLTAWKGRINKIYV